jgi:hypothetical protein
MLELQSPENLKLPDQKMMANVLNPANVESLILVMTVDILWGRLEEIKQKQGSNEVALLANWCHVFRALRYRLKFRRNLTSILPPTELARFDLQVVTFLFALNFSISPANLLRFLQHTEVQRMWVTILEKSRKETAKYSLSDLLPLLAVLWKVMSEENEKELADTSDKERESERDQGSPENEYWRRDNIDDESDLGSEFSYDRGESSCSMSSDVAERGEEREKRVKLRVGVDKAKLLKCGSHFLRDVLSYFLHDKPAKDYARTELKIFIESVKVFVSLCLSLSISLLSLSLLSSLPFPLSSSFLS